MSSVSRKLDRPGPKRLLALDGGGIRGMIAIEFLVELEDMLRARLRAPATFVLADYFDYVAGTSTGAIVAASIAIGLSARTIRSLYADHGAQMFAASRMRDRLKYRYSAERLRAILQEYVGERTTLGSDRLRTLLLLVMRNATTDSPWPISNNPRAKYNDRSLPDCNLELPLWQLIRASTAAPVYFPPEVIEVGTQRFVFSDGAVTTYNNPAFLLFLMSTLEPYRVGWPTGVDRLLLVSIGTGITATVNAGLRPEKMNLLYNVEAVPAALIHAAATEQDMLCRVFGASQLGAPLDDEIGDLANARGPLAEKLFRYVRYDADISRAGLDLLGLTTIQERAVAKLDAVAEVEHLSRVGRESARRLVRPEHFDGFLAAPDELEGTVAL